MTNDKKEVEVVYLILKGLLTQAPKEQQDSINKFIDTVNNIIENYEDLLQDDKTFGMSLLYFQYILKYGAE